MKLRTIHRTIAWAVLAVALPSCNLAHAETRVYLVRGWFGIFSTGLDKMAEELRGKGMTAEVIGHLEWKARVSEIVAARSAGQAGTLVLIGHSQGANNVIDMARELDRAGVPVALLITLAPWLQDPVPRNVARAVNYYQSPGWGSPLTSDPDFRGELVNNNVDSDSGILHINIDKDPRIQAEVVRAIAALSK